MQKITLKKIDETNFLSAFGLKLREGQERFVSHPVRSLAQAYVYYHQCTPFGIFCDEQMVGYVMVIYDYDLAEYDIWHMMIDKDRQGLGYGTAALQRCLEYIAKKPFGNSDRVVLTCHRENGAALALYRKFGFAETGNADDEEIERTESCTAAFSRVFPASPVDICRNVCYHEYNLFKENETMFTSVFASYYYFTVVR